MSRKTICASEGNIMSRMTMLEFYGCIPLHFDFNDPISRDRLHMILWSIVVKFTCQLSLVLFLKIFEH